MQINASAEWTARSGHVSVALPDGSNYLRDVWRSVDNGGSWTKQDDASWAGRDGLTSVVLLDGDIVVIGGSTQYEVFGDIWRLETLVSDTNYTYLPMFMKMP